MEKLHKRSSSALLRDQILHALGIVAAVPFVATTNAIAAHPSLGDHSPKSSAHSAQNISKPLTFEANVGQASSETLFLARGLGYHVLINAMGFDIQPAASKKLKQTPQPFSVKFTGVASDSRQLILENTGGVSRYYGRASGSNQALTANHYRKVGVSSVYHGVDIVYYGNDRHFEYDFILAPQADPRQIKMSVTGIDGAALDSEGNLNIVKDGRIFSQKMPVAFQEIAEGVRASVDARYVLARADDGTLSVALDIGTYDSSKQLIIDPLVISFSRTLGGIGEDDAYGIARDRSGNTYVAGASSSFNLPGSSAVDPYVTKLGASGDVVYTTYLQTDSGGGEANGIAVDWYGNAYVTGTIRGSLLGQSINGASDAFVAKLGASGDVGYLTTLGGAGDDAGSAIAIGSGGSGYVVGGRDINGTKDAFVAKLGASGELISESFFSDYYGHASQYTASAVAFGASGTDAWMAGASTVCNGSSDAFVAHIGASGAPDLSYCFGGGGDDYATGIGLDFYGNLHIIGNTSSTDFPLASPFQSARNDSVNGFFLKYHPGRHQLMQSSYLGGNLGGNGKTFASGIAVDWNGNAYIAGTNSGGGIPVVGGGYQQPYAGQSDAFLMKVGSSGTLDYSTYLGGAGDDSATGLALDYYRSTSGGVAVVGVTTSANYPVTGTSLPINSTEAFVTQYQSTSISPASITANARGLTGIVSVTSAAGSTWTVTSNASWITVTSGSSGEGNGSVAYSVAANTSSSARVGTLTIAGNIFTVTQSGAGVNDNFPPGAIPTGWVQPTGSSAAWFVTNDSAYGGSLSLRSGAIGHGQKSEIAYTATFASGTISFARKVSSEQGYDGLKFYIDGVLQGSWSGEMPWSAVSFPVTAGAHTLLWRYSKDSVCCVEGADAAWIDSVTLPTIAQPSAPAIGTATAGSGQASVAFTAGSLNGGTLTSHQAVCKNQSGVNSAVFSGQSSPIVVTGLTNGTIYNCYARTVTNIGGSTWSAPSNLVTPNVAPPAAPAIGTATAGSGRVSVAFTPGSLNGETLTSHQAVCKNQSGVNSAVFSGQSSPIVVTGLTNGTAYNCYARTVTNVGGSAWSAPSSQVTPAATQSTRFDFNGDGKADILWRNTTTGGNAAWFMNGAARSSYASPPAAATAWSVAGVADFNGDGKADILWRNAAGQNVVWLMIGATRTSAAAIPAAAAPWTFAGTGDFNNDGKADILWRNTSTGGNAVWFMNGAARSGYASPPAAATGWSIASVADFNGDGKADILWRNAAGQNSIWLMNGATRTSAAAIPAAAAPWTFAGTGDFNNDGKADILWRNTSTGGNAVWFMNGAARSNVGSPPAVATSWSVASVADFNGDGKADILWRNAAGQNSVWLMNGATRTSGTAIPPAAWPWYIMGW